MSASTPSSPDAPEPEAASLIGQIRWDERGLVPAIVQDDLSGQVLMLAYMNREALERTLETGEAYFWSRSRQSLWHKGESSGHIQRVRAVHIDCDGDTLLLLVDPAGPACHTGHRTCFYRRLDGETDAEAKPFRQRLSDLLAGRKAHPKETSYTSRLFQAGTARILQKVGEEAVEVIIAAQNEPRERLIAEAADLLYHLNVALLAYDIEWAEVDAALRERYHP
jgi:phosphoribosyl-ATP pyrophosphohydrolase/phosphoribosyl-AMP cyclohydrolase